MEIVPPQNFRYAHRIAARFTKYDPREHQFPEPDIAVNLRECSSVHPSAVLWCAVYLSLWRQRGFACLLRSPKDRVARTSLVDTGLLHLLSDEGVNVEIGDTDIYSSADTILPMTRFDSLREADELTNRVEESLYSSGLGSANVHPIVCELFSELVNNAAEHSESGVGAYGFVQFHSSGEERRFTCGVADGGIGIRQSIERNASLEHFGNEWSAIALATKELVSGTSSATRGIGLFSVFDEMRHPGRELVIHSGKGILIKSEDTQVRFIKTNLFPGTLVYFSVPA